MMWYDMMWCDMIYVIYDMIYDIYGMIWYDMIWYDMIWYDMIWYDIWYDTKKNKTLSVYILHNIRPQYTNNDT